ncbi:hypothetical protein OZX68_03070 [Streptococcaceae bacterium ESL0729]|nr:hypothetical protein OZX68_03070 [Streptococcaceae bacterium ESL0729]
MKNKYKFLSLTCVAALLVAGLAGCSKKETSKGVIIEESTVSASSTEVSGLTSQGESLSEEEINEIEDFQTVGEFKDSLTDGQNPKITHNYTFDTNYTDTSWDKISFTIDQAKLVETDKFKEADDEDEYSGALALRYKIENTGDEEISLHPDDASIILTDGTEIKAKSFSTSLISKFKKGSKEGNIRFKFNKPLTSDLVDIASIKVSFKGKVGDKEEVVHQYDVNLAGNASELVEKSN